ncbi:MAG: hypothetical protein WC029_10530 [Sulfuricella sp.]|jgi:hypothetical protein
MFFKIGEFIVRGFACANQTQTSHCGYISRRDFLRALGILPFAMHIGSDIACASSGYLHLHETDNGLAGLRQLAEILRTKLPKIYEELRTQLSMDLDLSTRLDKGMHLLPQKVANEFENNEYIVIDGCMFSKSELQLSIFLVESKGSYVALSNHTDNLSL